MISACEALGALPRSAGPWTRGDPELLGPALSLPFSRGAEERRITLGRPLVPSLSGAPPEIAALLRSLPADARWPRWEAPVLVVTSGVPRSGTSWVDRLARALVRAAGIPLSSGTFAGGRDDDFPTNAPGDAEHRRLRSFVEAAPQAHCLKTHFLSDLGPRADLRLLYVFRDPRDVVLSTGWYALAGPARDAFSGGTREQAFAAVTGMVLPPLVRSLRAALDAPPNTLLVAYEDLVARPEEGIERIARHLGVALPPGFAGAAARGLSFRRESGRERGVEDRSSYHRKGIVGGWREDLPPAQREAIERALPDREELLEALRERAR